MKSKSNDKQAALERENAELRRQLAESLDYRTAIGDVLKVISRSVFDLDTVFAAVAVSATRLCQADHAGIYRNEGDGYRWAGGSPPTTTYLEKERPQVFLPGHGSLVGRVALEGRVVQIEDAWTDPLYEAKNDLREAGVHSLLGVPLLRGGAPIGVIGIARRRVELFTEKQIELVSIFADEAVIAMENARLLTETREALDQQTATAEVLQVINASPGDLAPVFEAMLDKAMRLCDASGGALRSYDGEAFHAAAMRGVPATFAEATQLVVPDPVTALGRIERGAHVIQIPDLTDPKLSQNNSERRREMIDLGGIRTALWVALRKDDALLGTFVLYRDRVQPFTDKQIALVENFAQQAVIAMENARLMTETREALDQQTATAEVLQVINSSPGDLAPVFNAILEKAHGLCGATRGTLFLFDGETFRAAAMHGYPQGQPPRAIHVSEDPRLASFLAGERLIHIPDLTKLDDPIARSVVERGGVRTNLLLPLRNDGVLRGVISCNREEVRPFSDKDIALLENFAAQAAIAIENARLITETREALDQQTATAEVLGVINSSPGDLAPVFDVLLDKAMQLCGAAFGVMATYGGANFQWAAHRGLPQALSEFFQAGGEQPGSTGGHARLLHGAPLVHIADMQSEEAYRSGEGLRRAMVELGGARTALVIPLRKDAALLGSFTLYRQEVRPFTDKHIALLQSFAAQAVIAMENARLITETRQRTGELQQSLEYQTATSDVLKVISQSTSDLRPVLDFVCRTAARLCNVQTGSIFRLEAGAYRWATGFGLEPAYEAAERTAAIAPGVGTLVGRVALTGETVHILDGAADPHYEAKEELRLSKCHTLLGVPLLREGAVIGVICMARFAIDAFTEKQIALVSTFADQAVIAIENARLFNELHDRTAEVTELNRGLEARVAEQVDELGRVGRLKRFLAPQLAELIVSQGDEKILESHRREIVVVFCDLRGYTAFTETAEPEEVLDFLREYHGALGPLVAEFEGTLDQFSGDGIMVFFNDPVPIPDPAERAVKMAMAMREAAGALTAIWRRRGRELGFGAGIAQGYATLGQIGFSERSGYTAIGTVCNVAARLCAEAKDGQILIAQRVAAGLDGDVALEELGPLPLKGITQPVAAFNVASGGGPGRLRLVET